MHHQTLVALREKYSNLFWYARSSHPAGANGRDRVELLYPAEVAKLRAATTGWDHGFNAGVMATLRLVTALLVKENTSVARIQAGDVQPADEVSDDSEQSIDEVMVAMQAFSEFPMLDS